MKPDKKLHYFGAYGISLASILIRYFYVMTGQIIFLYTFSELHVLIFGKEYVDHLIGKIENEKVRAFFAKIGLNGTGFSISDIIYGELGLASGLVTGLIIISIIQII